MMRFAMAGAAALVLMFAGGDTALADSTNSGPITENSHHHEFTNCSGLLLACVDVLDI